MRSMSRRRLLLPRPRRLSLVAAFGSLLLAVGAAGAMAPAASAQTNLLANGGFAAGSTSGWTCSSGDSVVTSPTYDGASYALAGTPNGSDYAQCSQVVSVQPSSSYSLTGQVEGDYVYLGDSGTGTSDTDTWTPSATTWTGLSTNFTTGVSTTSVTIYIHGWYAQPTFYADDLELTGPAGSGGGGTGTSAPAAPTGLTVTGTTSSSASLSWTAPSGTVSGYYVDENGSQVASVTGTSDTVTGLAASTTYKFTVVAYNSAGSSPASAAVSATTAASSGGGGGSGLPAHILMGYWQDFT
ncbi:MAG: fibronectin type III domain-containing protein, partial [Trebonia sp.]